MTRAQRGSYPLISRSFLLGRFDFGGGSLGSEDRIDLLEQLVVFGREGRIGLAREVVLDLDRECRSGDRFWDLVLLDPFDREDLCVEAWWFRGRGSLVLRDSCLVIHRRCRCGRGFVLDREREGGSPCHLFEDHIVRFVDLRVVGRIFVAEEARPSDRNYRNYRSVWGKYYFVKEALDLVEDTDLVVTVSLDRDLDRKFVVEVVCPSVVFVLLMVALLFHFPFPYLATAGLFSRHRDRAAAAAGEEHCDPNSLDRLEESIYFSQEEVLTY